MSWWLQILSAVAAIAVVVVLILGLRNLLTGGSGNRSNKLMQARIFLQFVAVFLMVAAIFLFRDS